MENVLDEREQNPEAQLEPMRNYCKAMGWTIIHEFVDRESGSSFLRPEFRAMIERLTQKEVDCLMVWKLDRLSRFKAIDALTLIAELKKRCIAIKSIQEPWADTTVANPTTDLLLFITAWIAEQERKSISDRTKAGIAAKKLDKTWRGGRPKGSKDKHPRADRRWDKRPDLSVPDLFAVKK